MKFQQRDIVEVSFELPDGTLKIHPALVISNDEIFDVEDIFYAVMILPSHSMMNLHTS